MKTIEGISNPMLKKYVQTRMEMAAKAESVLNLTYLISLLERCDQDTIPINPKVLAFFADRINSEVHGLIEQLDQFIYILDAENQLDGKS